MATVRKRKVTLTPEQIAEKEASEALGMFTEAVAKLDFANDIHAQEIEAAESSILYLERKIANQKAAAAANAAVAAKIRDLVTP